jgi:hypothetical protein
LWGDSLEELVAKVPGGQHYFAHGGGQRDYSVANEKELLGLPRNHMQVHYFFDENNSVVSVSIMFPYEQRARLLGSLTLSYGTYKQRYTKGISNYYVWPTDDGTTISVVETFDPKIGILALSISGPNSALLQKVSSDCNKQPTVQAKR